VLACTLLYQVCDLMIEEVVMRTLFLCGLISVCLACSVVTPPPMMARHGSAMPAAVGEGDLTMIGIGASGAFVDPVAGGELRGVSQVTDNLAVGAGLGGAYRLPTEDSDDDPPDLALGGRIIALYNPGGLKWMRVVGGTGGGLTDTGLAYATADVGALFSWTFFDRLTPYGGPAVAVSIPVTRGAAMSGAVRPGVTGWAGGMVGVEYRLSDKLYTSVEGSILEGWSTNGEAAGIFVGSVGLRYRFDAEP
jgi:hypothetical protein